jgi:hypothetical protein
MYVVLLVSRRSYADLKTELCRTKTLLQAALMTSASFDLDFIVSFSAISNFLFLTRCNAGGGFDVDVFKALTLIEPSRCTLSSSEYKI